MPPSIGPTRDARYRFGPFRLDIQNHRILQNERAVSWRSELHFDLLKTLIDAAPNVVSYDDLRERVWHGKNVDLHTIAQTVKNLRERLGRYADCIRNQPGKGYYFDRPPSESLSDGLPLETATLLEVAAAEWNRRTGTSLLRALTLFRRAVELNPNCVQGHLGVAACITMGCHAGFAVLPHPELENARLAAAAASLLAADNRTKTAAICQVAQLRMMYDWDFKDTERLLEKAYRLDETYPPIHQFLAYLYLITGRWPEVMNAITRARTLAPSSPMLHSTAGLLLHLMRRHTEAVTTCESAVSLHPDFSRGYGILGMAQEGGGHHEAAMKSFEHAIQIEEYAAGIAGLGHAAAVTGDRTRARGALAHLRKMAKSQAVGHYFYALIYAGLDDVEQAVTCLEQAYLERCDWLIHAGVDPRWDNLREHRRFKRLIRKIGLPEV